MSEVLGQDDVSVGRRARRPSTIQELFSESDSNGSRGDIVLRCVAAGEGFAKTLTCHPGSIMVLPGGKQAQSFAPFRQALLGRDAKKQVSIRAGQFELDPSEIHSVLPSEVLEPGRTVAQALLYAGVRSETLLEMASSVGLETHLDVKTERADPRVLSRLTVAIAIWSRARIVYLDSPFAEVGSEWIPSLANFLLQSVAGSDRVVIVSGLEKLPRMWKSSPLVEVAGTEIGVYEGDIQVIDETMGYLKRIRHLIGSSTNTEDCIVTYPQRIFRRRTPSDSALCLETIANPNLTASEQTLYSVKDEPAGASKKTDSARRKRKPTSGKLTRVGRVERFRRRSAIIAMRSLFFRQESRLQQEPVLAHERIERYRREQEHREQLEFMLLIVIFLIAVLLFLNWV